MPSFPSVKNIYNMKTCSTICICLLIAFAISCKPPEASQQIPKEESMLSVAPIVIKDAVRSQNHKMVTLTFTEQMKYEPRKLEVSTTFFKTTPEGICPVEGQDKISYKWLTTENNGSQQLIVSDLKDFTRLTVDVIYKSEKIETRTFDF